MKSEDAIRIHRENINEFSTRAQLSISQRKCSVSEISELLLNEKDLRDASELYENFVCLTGAELEDKAELTLKLSCSKKYGSSLRDLTCFGNRESAKAGSHGKVAIVRNKYNEEAFNTFSRVITRAKSVVVPSFSDGCEDVYDGRCEFCILPVESSLNGRLFGFYSMLDRYELRICAVCSIDLDGEQETVRYALVGRSTPDRLPKASVWEFECTVLSASGIFPSDILSVVGSFQAEIIKLDSLPVSYDNVQKKYYFTFRLPKERIPAFNFYLYREHSGYTPIGIYPHVN